MATSGSSGNNSSSSKNTIGFSNGSKHNKSDIDAFKNLGTNKGEYGTSFSRRKNDNDDEEEEKKEEPKKGLNKKDGLDEKEGLKKKENLEKKIKEKDKAENVKNNNKTNHKKSTLKDKVLENNPVTKLKKKIKRMKLYLIIAGIIVSIAMTFFIFICFFIIFDRIINSISTFFGISEVDTEENMSVEDADGLLTDEEYLIDSETGEYYTLDGLVDYLKESNDKCTKSSFFTNIIDKFTGIDDICTLLRYVDNREKVLEKIHEDLKLDRALILSSIFYGYSFQADYSEMEDATNEEVIPSTRYYTTFEDIFSEGKLTKTNIDDLIDNSYADTSYNFYTWTIEDEKDKNGNVKATVGKCVKSEVKHYGYNSQKWKIFMRFGETAANKYVELMVKQNAYNASSEECTGKMSNEELLELVRNAGTGTPELSDEENTSVQEAQDYLPDEPITGLEAFYQEADNENSEKDIFEAYTDQDGTVKFDYKNGFVYNNFPYFKESIEDPNINISYDEVITPKVCEDAIDYILEKKPDMNEVLNLEDMDEGYSYLYNASTETSVILGAFCGNYLTAPIDSIRVEIHDCDGRVLTTTSMKEYITGVAYREVSDKEDDYVKAEMVAALSYALHRRNNNKKGTVIVMRSGNCDQAYCPMSLGCHSETAALSCGSFNCTSYIPGPGSGQNTSSASAALINKYNSYYEEIKDFLIVKGDDIYGVSYVSSTQNQWYQKAAAGMSFTQIIQETYSDGTLIKCSETNDGTTTSETDTTSETGNGPEDNEIKYGKDVVENKYTEVSQDLGNNYGFSYSRNKNTNSISINPEWTSNNLVTINSNCSEASWDVDYKVNVHSKEKFEKAYSNICNILTNGVKISNGKTCKYSINDLTIGNTFIPRETLSGIVSDSSYGIAQDFNYNKSYVINGKTYTPYNSNSSLEDYLEFVSALGNEEDCRNINYILYKYAFEDAGFIWGGNLGRNGNDGKFNAMHYRIDY